MHIVAVGWIFVVVLMAAAEATAPQGTWLGALATLLLYGALPLSIVLYVMAHPCAAERARRPRRDQRIQMAAACRPVTRSRLNEKKREASLWVHTRRR